MVDEDIEYLSQRLGEIEQVELTKNREQQMEFGKGLLEQKLHYKELEQKQAIQINRAKVK